MRELVGLSAMMNHKELIAPVFTDFKTKYNALGKRSKGRVAMQDINNLIAEVIDHLQGQDKDLAEGFLETVLGAMIGMGNSVDAFKTISVLLDI